MNNKKTIINVKIRRWNSSEGGKERYVEYQVPIKMGWSVSNVLKYINENFEGGLAHYLSCRKGVCGGCVVRVNGKPKLACTEIVKKDITLDPATKDRVVKDLVCFPRTKI